MEANFLNSQVFEKLALFFEIAIEINFFEMIWHAFGLYFYSK